MGVRRVGDVVQIRGSGYDFDLWTVKRSVLNPVRLWHKNGALSQSRSLRAARPLDAATLESLALGYVGRFATTQARLAGYLRRKVAARGWADSDAPQIDAIIARFVAVGYLDDAQFAEARSRSLARRGYGHRRLEQSLNASGVARSIVDALVPEREAARASAEAFARRRRIGPFCDTEPTPAERKRHFAALVRAGHDFEFARIFSASTYDDTIDD